MGARTAETARQEAQRLRALVDHGLIGRADQHFRIASSADKVKLLSPNHRLLIALRSPDGVVETGLCMGPPEKNAPIACLWRSAGHFLRSGFGDGIAELRRFLAILAGMQPYFSATQTGWRSEWDSNPPLNVSSTTYNATDGTFRQSRHCKTVVMAGEWQVKTGQSDRPAQTILRISAPRQVASCSPIPATFILRP
jgi:hypothetical protein